MALAASVIADNRSLLSSTKPTVFTDFISYAYSPEGIGFLEAAGFGTQRLTEVSDGKRDPGILRARIDAFRGLQ